MTLNSVWWRFSSNRALENVEYPFIAITPRSTLTQSGGTCLGLIYGWNRTFSHLLRNNIISYLKSYSRVQIIYIT